ncbi:MAG: TolC family protein [Paludibacteraceae bacterium]|nr:TolC family protein [Paludibacteraceae bacterium]
MKRPFLFLLLTTYCLAVSGQQLLTLDGCRNMAVQNNKQSQIDHENIAAAQLMRKAALANFFPKFSANGAYMYNTSNAHILPSVLELSNGYTLSSAGYSGWQPQTSFGKDIQAGIGGAFDEIYNSLTLDFHHVFAAQVGLVQPIYVGGKVINSYKLMKSYERLEQIKGQKNNAQLMVDVEEAYWRVLSVNEKRKLAQQYTNLLRTLLSNVEAALEEGVATQADILKVRVKLNEAESSLSKAENGLALSKMALCQLVGLPLNEDIILDDTGLDDAVLQTDEVSMNEILANREELQMLAEAKKMAKAGVGLAGSFLQPNIVAGANYIATNPNVKDGFKNDFGGFFSVGVAVNLPIAHASDILNYKAAKHKAKTVELQMEEASEKIELQATQDKHRVIEANNSLLRAKANIKSAEENLRFAKEAYDEGVATATDVMMAQTAWENAYTEKIDAAVTLRMAELTFRQHTGMLK